MRALVKYGLGTEDDVDGHIRCLYPSCRGGWEETIYMRYCQVCGDCRNWREGH